MKNPGINFVRLSAMNFLRLTLILLMLSGFGCHYAVYDQNDLLKPAIPPDPRAFAGEILDVNDTFNISSSLLKVVSSKLYFSPEATPEAIHDTLKNISRELGLDIIKINSLENISWEEDDTSFFEVVLAALANMETESDIVVYEALELQFDAYKYYENIRNADLIPYSKKLFYRNQEDQKDSLLATEYLLPSGERKKLTGRESVYNRLALFDLSYVLEDQSEEWEYRLTQKSELVRRNARHLVRIIMADMGGRKTPVEVFIKERQGSYNKYVMSIFYDPNFRVSSKEVLMDGSLYASIDYEYDEKGRITLETVKLPAEKQTFEIRYDYYSLTLLRHSPDTTML